MRNMLAIYVNVKYDNGAELLPVVELDHHTACDKALEETRQFLKV